MQKYLNIYVRVVDRASDYVGIVAMYLIFLMVGILLLDAVTRNVINIPLHWGIEAAQFTLAAYYFMGGAMTIKNDDHVRMDLFYGKYTRKGKDWIDVATIGCLLFYLVVMLIGSISSLEYAIETNEKRFSMWNPSMIPIKVLMVGCIGLMILQTISMIIKHISDLRGKKIT
jgi:TRAP-type mannitol/chloroaromatic compound transport system permease small subunit